jgi:hypothetical protein
MADGARGRRRRKESSIRRAVTKHGRRTKAAEVERAEFQRLVQVAWEMLKLLRGLLSLSACQVSNHSRSELLLRFLTLLNSARACRVR